MLKVAFVVQRCGREVNGGAESACLQIAQHLAKTCEIDILTTCALDYMSWENWYPSGSESIGQATVHRFLVDRPRDVMTFNELSRELLSRKSEATTKEQEDWMSAQGPISASLLEYLRTHSNDYDAFIFFGYLYATTYFGLPLVADKSYLVPFAHDEWPIYLPMWERIFDLPKCLIFSTDAERRFLQKRFPGLSLSGPTIGVGISAPANVDPTRFRRKYGFESPFLLYAGRVDASKGCDVLFEYFSKRRQEVCTGEKLVVIGKEVMPVPFDDDIIYLGFLPDEQRWDAMAACEWIVLPSPYESFSLALLETWSVGRPAIVNAACEVLVDHCRQANGGLWYSNFEEWHSILTVVPDAVRKALGRQGMDYVRRCYSWPRIEKQYRSLLGL